MSVRGVLLKYGSFQKNTLKTRVFSLENHTLTYESRKNYTRKECSFTLDSVLNFEIRETTPAERSTILETSEIFRKFTGLTSIFSKCIDVDFEVPAPVGFFEKIFKRPDDWSSPLVSSVILKRVTLVPIPESSIELVQRIFKLHSKRVEKTASSSLKTSVVSTEPSTACYDGQLYKLRNINWD
jgi:hypothetical protein